MPVTTTTAPPTTRPMHRVDETWVGTGPQVVFLGDSLTVVGDLPLISALPNRASRIIAFFGEGFSGGPFSTGFGLESVVYHDAQRLSTSERPDVVVLALGTNDAWRSTLPATSSIAGIDRMVALFPESCIVATTVDEDVPEQTNYSSDHAHTINGHLATVSDVVVDWQAEIDADPSLVASDGIHLTTAGSNRRAAVAAAAVDDCLSRSGAGA